MNLQSSARRPAFTLIELLVVIVILLMITAAVVPIMAPAMANRQIREAARLTSSYISGARVRAIETGRPVAVMIEPASLSTNSGVFYSMNLSYAEVPLPWAGESVNTRMSITDKGVITGFAYPGSTGTVQDLSWKGLIRAGDSVRLDFKGRTYRLFAGEPFNDLNGDGTYTNGVDQLGDCNGDGQYTPASSTVVDKNGFFTVGPDSSQPFWTLGCIDASAPVLPMLGSGPAEVSFQIIRQPVRSLSQPIQLPEGVVIDLNRSGTVNQDPFTLQPAIVFSPAGNVESYYNGTTNRKPLGPIFILLGRRELMADVAESGVDMNVAELTNLWIGVGHQTGLVTTTENGGDFDGDGNVNLVEARRFAQAAQNMGGK